MNDVLVLYWRATGDVAKMIGDMLHKNGYTIELVDAEESDCSHLADRAMVVVPVVTGKCMKGMSFGDICIVPIWPNNSPRPEGLPIEASTLDMVGTDLAVSLDKACERFPDTLRKKNSSIRDDIKYGNWVNVLETSPGLADLCPFDQLSGDDWDRLLCSRPQFGEYCDWSKLSGINWRSLLRQRPEFCKHCEWEELDGGDWAEILSEQPDLSGYCDWSKIKKSYDWVKILSKQPRREFIERCDFSIIDGYRWVDLLEAQPQFAERCNWRKLNGRNWADLLTKKPEYADKCDWSKLGSEAWLKLLQECPEFSDKCAWTKLNGAAWSELLQTRPEFSAKCDWRKFGADDWLVLRDHPEFEHECRHWSRFNGEIWRLLLASQPCLAQKCNWKRLAPQDWMWLLVRRPEFAGKCDWEKLRCFTKATDWIELLTKQPQFADKCDPLVVDWSNNPELLSRFPSIMAKCDWSRFSEETIVILLSKHPEFADKVDFSKLKSSTITKLAQVNKVFDGLMRQFPNDVDASAEQADVFICSGNRGRCAARRLGEALARRDYAVFVDENDIFSDMDRVAIDAAKYFMLIRSEGLFDEIMVDGNPLADQIKYALNHHKRIVSIGPTDQRWQDPRHLPDSFTSIETNQVKNLDMGDLFEEKVDALVRESMKNEQGSLAKKYDVFISYRRLTGANFARRIHQKLKDLGYLAFLDYNCILNGRYDKVITSAIESAPVFLPLLTEGSLDRCAEAGDWVAAEIEMALEQGKCVIPITPDNQKYSIPASLPKELDPLRAMKVWQITMDEDGFAKSVEEITRQFPLKVQNKAKKILAAIRNPGDMRTIGNAHDTPLTDVLKKWPDALSLFNYREFDNGTWKLILCHVPQLAPKCDWSNLCSDTVMEILRERPELADYCDFSRLEGWQWESLLRERPEFADICEWRKFSGEDWNCLYRDNPELARKYGHFMDWTKFPGGNWSELLKHRPEVAEKCDLSKINGADLSELLEAHPALIKKFDTSRMDARDWVELLTKRPEFKKYFKDWWLLDGDCWACLLSNCPEEDFDEHCDWFKLNGKNWLDILLVNGAGAYDPISPRIQKWVSACEVYAAGCDWSGLDGYEWCDLVNKFPQFSDWCDWTTFNQTNWRVLLELHPEFGDKCRENGFETPVSEPTSVGNSRVSDDEFEFLPVDDGEEEEE